MTFSVAKEGAFVPADAHRLNLLAPTQRDEREVREDHVAQRPGGGAGDHGQFFYDLSEMEVYGNPPNVLPSGTLAASPSTVAPGATVTLTASFTDPDSAITGYDWDFDGNGLVYRTTAGLHHDVLTRRPAAGEGRGEGLPRRRRPRNHGQGHEHDPEARPAGPDAEEVGNQGQADLQGPLLRRVQGLGAGRSTRKTAPEAGAQVRTVGSSSRRSSQAPPGRSGQLSRKVIRAMRRHHVRKLKAALKVRRPTPTVGARPRPEGQHQALKLVG